MDKNKQDKLIIKIDLNIYNQKVITSTVYKFTDKYYISQECNDKTISVSFSNKSDNTTIDWIFLKKEFENELINQQVRYDVEQKFGYIRNLIVEKAFSPIN